MTSMQNVVVALARSLEASHAQKAAHEPTGASSETAAMPSSCGDQRTGDIPRLPASRAMVTPSMRQGAGVRQ